MSKRLMTALGILMLALFAGAAAAQDIQSIVDRNPFDPDRGRKEDVDAEEEEAVPVVAPEELPTLDGTMIMGEVKIAMFSLVQDGKPATARVVMDAGGSDYTLHMRGEEELQELRNGRLGGYLIGDIQLDYVELKNGDNVLKLDIFANKDKKRGGTKTVAKQAPVSPSRPPQGLPQGQQDNEPKVTKLGQDEEPKALPKPSPRPSFNRRRVPPKVRDAAEDRRERLKKKF